MIKAPSMKAYADLAEELGSNINEHARRQYNPKIKGSSKISPGRHHAIDYTGRKQLATRKLAKGVSDKTCAEIDQLLQDGANPNVVDTKGRTPLHFAASQGDTAIVRTLLSHGASCNEQDNIGNTPLHLACVAGHIDTVTLLLKAGTDIMATDTRGSTPLHLALSRLRMLSLSTSDEFVVVQRKMEVEKIIEMLKDYLSMSSSVDNDDDEETDILLYVNHRAGGSNIRKLDELAGKLSLSTTGQEVDEVKTMLESFTELSIKQRNI